MATIDSQPPDLGAGPPPDPVEQLYTGLQAEGAAPSAPNMGAVSSPSLSPTGTGQLPTAAQSPTVPPSKGGTVAKATATASSRGRRNLGLEALVNDPSFIQSLQDEASGHMTLGQVIATAGLAAANPEMAQQHLQLRNSRVNYARQLLAQLEGTESANVRAEARLTQEKADEEKKARRERATRITAEAADQNIKIGAAPQIGSPDYEKWEADSIAAIAKEGGKRKAADRLSKISQNVLQRVEAMSKLGANPDIPSLLQLEGATQEEIANMKGAFPGLAATVGSVAEFARRKQRAEIDRMNALSELGKEHIRVADDQLYQAQEALKEKRWRDAISLTDSLNNTIKNNMELQGRLLVTADQLDENNPGAGTPYRNASINLMNRMPDMMAQSDALRGQAYTLSQTENPAIRFQQIYTVDLSNFWHVHQQMLGSTDPEAWLRQNPYHPDAKAFWEGVARKLAQGNPAQLEASRKYVHDIAITGANTAESGAPEFPGGIETPGLEKPFDLGSWTPTKPSNYVLRPLPSVTPQAPEQGAQKAKRKQAASAPPADEGEE